MAKILVVATSRKTRGGITSVVKAHETGRQWSKYHCKWIETHRDGHLWIKIWYLVNALLKYACLLPSYDLVHIHLSEPVSAMRKTLFFSLARLTGKKILVHFHAFSIDTTINGKYKGLYKYLFSKADYVIVLSKYWKDELNKAFSLGDKIIVVYNPCTTTISTSFCQKKKQILYAGTMNARKGYADMIKAFSEMAAKHKDWQIVFAGNGEIEKGKALASEFGIYGQTVFCGWVNGEQKDKLFMESEIFCLPSYAEGFPMAVLDAWAYGLPVITTPVGGIPDIAQDKKNMLLFTPGDTTTLARQMERMISDEELRNAIAAESKKLAASTFSVNAINNEIGKLYEKLSKQNIN